ncbi:DNA-methyltransferase [Litorivita pollutaquae]|nr:site-specific DNA-methyltransferase [Litorivita pollutaquae]
MKDLFDTNTKTLSALINEDCLETLKTIKSNSVDAQVYDPPYDDVLDHDWDKNLNLFPIWEESFRVLKPGGYLVVFGDHRRFHRTICELEDIGFTLISGMAWTYNNGTPACQKIDDLHHTRVKPGQEPIGLFMKPLLEKTYKVHRKKHGNSGLRVKNTVPGVKMTKSTFDYQKPTPTERNLGVEHLQTKRVNKRDESGRSLYRTTSRKNHGPCVKPVQLMYHLLKLVTPEGGTVMDAFMGTGATGMAAAWAGFNFIGIERDKSYFEVAKLRVEYALNNQMPSFPLHAAKRRKISITEKSYANRASHTTPWIEATTDLGALVPLRRPIRVKRAIQKLLASVSTLWGNAVNSFNGSVNKGKVSGRRHTEKTVSIAGVLPNGTNLPFNRLPFVEVLPLVFHNKNAAIGQHCDKVGVEFPVGHLQPEGRSLPVNVAHPVSDLFVPVDVQGTVPLFVTVKRANKREVMLVELGRAGIGPVRRVALLIEDDGQVRAGLKVLRVGGKKGTVLRCFSLAAKIILVAAQHIQLNPRGHQFFYGLGYEYYRAWLGDIGMNDAAFQPVGEARQGPSRLPNDARKLAL